MTRELIRIILQAVRTQLWSLTLLGLTLMGCVLVGWCVIWPAYQNPQARMYTSSLGYASVLRQTDSAFPVKSAVVSSRTIVGKFIGEGLMQSEPVQVPMVAMAGIKHVHAVEGQQVRSGDLIVELDDSRVHMKIESARAALKTAKSELERVRLGTVNVLQEERPDLLALRAQSAAEEVKLARQILKSHRVLVEKGSISRSEYAQSKLALIRALLGQRERNIAAEMAASGRQSSIKIGESAIREAELTLEHRTSQLKDYRSYAPADGVVERVLVHAGEYNQDPGRPAVLLACGSWFECYLDQTALGCVQVGDRVEVRLSAYQDRVFSGAIQRVRPLVNFALGGPETNRPIRPLGTGAPEWPATFSVRIALEETQELVVPGLTGYATVIQQRQTLAVPRGTVSAVSGNRGIVFVVDEEKESFQPRNVVTGIRDDQFIEIKEGLQDGETVIVDGHQVLQPGDRIAVSAGPPSDPIRDIDNSPPARLVKSGAN